MLSIGKLGPGQDAYYLEQAGGPVSAVTGVASGVEDYYMGGSEPAGRWCGRGAAVLELAGQVAGPELRAVLAGQRPDGTQLRARGSVPGFDVTFSAPKSVSVLFGVGQESLRQAVAEAHEVAVREALAYLDTAAAVARRGAGGARSVAGDGLVGAAFLHRTSRAGDPQLHTHVLLANMTRGPDGRWSALDGRALYAHGRTAGYVYQAALRTELTRRLGVEWEPVRKGQAEIAGVPARVLRAFSRRREEIEAAMRSHGSAGAAAARVAALATRRAKDYGVTAETLREEWRQRAVVLGLSDGRVAALLARKQPATLSETGWRDLFDHLAGPDGMTQRRSTFARGDLIRTLCESVPAGTGPDAILEATATFIDTRAVRVLRSAPDPRGPLHSTSEMLAVERRVLDTAVRLRDAGRGVASQRAIAQALARASQLSDEQETMVRQLTGAGDGVAVVIGKAGAGKTTALVAARDAWQASGLPVQGCAVGRRAAQQLGLDSGMPSTSIAALLSRGDLEPQTVLVVDEAGMLGTRMLDELLNRVERVDGKLVLTGDPRQLPAIDAGGGLRGLATRLGYIELNDNRRQHHAWERDALELLREGQGGPALTLYERHGRVSVSDREDEAFRQLIADWHAADDREGTAMIAHRRSDVSQLNGRARAVLVQEGRLGTVTMTTPAGTFATGDVVLVRRNSLRLDVRNGERGVVHAVDADGLYVRFGDRFRVLPRDFLESRTPHGDPAVQHGYAMTAYAAQGMTCQSAFVLARDDLYREWAYTAMSRGRDSNRLYVIAQTTRPRDEIAPAEPARDAREALIAALGRSQSEAMASDLDRTRSPEEQLGLDR
jgi:conjugative relaxase-like TrwC/TraI family protein